MNDLDMLFDAAEFEKATASSFSVLAADCGSEELRQMLLQHHSTIQQHQRQFAQLMAKLQGSQRNPV
ncbi:spore coat protein [Paenactinomyces guangxiensis]|uniref:Spore coat protein n=1 Tax=Paenactinomyces guangxiensis TaxID=1490290 RepID=A0A7W1WSW5_9BACL|nr:spore coat protein [Paenactinomyces guangxiensis]MBA4495236.1 spore coat protein [Paenactinomyces guangxiensis]MBH8592320.1 spore coat protein [Paenactinomyces guangxiensis]